MTKDIQRNERFGRLKVIDNDYSTDDYQRRLVLCECDCGRTKPVLATNLKQGRTHSCGMCTPWGGHRKRPYKPRKTAHAGGKRYPVATDTASELFGGTPVRE